MQTMKNESRNIPDITQVGELKVRGERLRPHDRVSLKIMSRAEVPVEIIDIYRETPVQSAGSKPEVMVVLKFPNGNMGERSFGDFSKQLYRKLG
ncbi:MAG: hypothetical protein AAB573_01790 [Patescibacteria group bacterium]